MDITTMRSRPHSAPGATVDDDDDDGRGRRRRSRARVVRVRIATDTRARAHSERSSEDGRDTLHASASAGEVIRHPHAR